MAKHISTQRAAYNRSLAVLWIKEHRPDIWAKIREEGFKVFPAPGLKQKGPNIEAPPGFNTKKWD